MINGYLTVHEMAGILNIKQGAVNRRLFVKGIKPTEMLGSTGLYDSGTLDIIKDMNKVGGYRPKKTDIQSTPTD